MTTPLGCGKTADVKHPGSLAPHHFIQKGEKMWKEWRGFDTERRPVTQNGFEIASLETPKQQR